MTTDKKLRKEQPMARGLLDYFPEALAEVAHVSFVGNRQHNPGEEMHWAREKSKDHADCIARHLIERGTLDDDGLRHSAKVAWRALAMLQLEIEKDRETQVTYKGIPIEYVPELSSLDTGQAWKDANGNIYAIRSHPEGRSVVTESLTKPKPIVYISGPMRGLPQHNFPAFDAAKHTMQCLGFEVISPADLDRQDPTMGRPVHIYVERDVAALIRVKQGPHGSLMVLLPGWEESMGAKGEKAIAEWLGVEVKSIREFT